MSSGRVDQGMEGGLQSVDIFEDQGGKNVAFDCCDTLSGIRPHRMRVFVFVYHDPLCCVDAGPPRLSVCLSGTKLG